MAGRPLAHGFDGFRVGPRACGTWSHSGLLSGVWSERAPAVSSPGCSASSLTPAQTREARRQHKPRGQCGLAGGIGHPIGLWARRMPRSTGGKGHERPPRSSPPLGALRCGSPRRTAMRAPGRTIPHVSSSHLSQTCALCWNPAIILQGAHKAMEHVPPSYGVATRGRRGARRRIAYPPSPRGALWLKPGPRQALRLRGRSCSTTARSTCSHAISSRPTRSSNTSPRRRCDKATGTRGYGRALRIRSGSRSARGRRIILTTSLSGVDQICPRRIAVLQSQATRESRLGYTRKSLC
jgi:hypothetical protein